MHGASMEIGGTDVHQGGLMQANRPFAVSQDHDMALALPAFFRLGIDCLLSNVRPELKASRASARDAELLPLLNEIQEEVARRMAQRLHDESSQLLAVIYMDLADIAREVPAHTNRKVDGVLRKLDDICAQLRAMSHEYRPLVLEQKGLLVGLRELADGAHKRSGLRITCSGSLDQPLDPGRSIVLYRVVQEALSNVLRHAAATCVDIRVWVQDARVHCTVSDDGIGISPECGTRQRWCGLGLLGAHERVTAAGGSVRLRSRQGEGTELTVELPL